MPRTLLLEADDTYAAEIRRGLVRLGFEVVLIREGKVGLARAVSERFDLLVVSAELPAVNGFRICNRVKKDPNVGDVPVFMMGSSEADLATHSQLPTHADDYFTKPIVFDELAARIRLRGLLGGDGDITEVSRVRVDLEAVATLQQKLVEQEAIITELSLDLGTARAQSMRSDAQAKEIERLRASLDEKKRVTSMRPPKGASAADEASLQQLRTEHTRALASVERALSEQKSAVDGLRVKLAAAEAQARTHEAKARDDARELTKLKKQLDGALADKEYARKRIDELSARATHARPELERLREEIAAAKSASAEAQATAARTLDAERQAWEAARSALEQGLREARDRAAVLDEELAQQRALRSVEIADVAERAARLEASAAEKAAEAARLQAAFGDERGAHAATRARAESAELDLEAAKTTAAEQRERIAGLERELAETQAKEREATRALSDFLRRAKALGDDRARLAERAAKAEEATRRAESELAMLRASAAETKRSVRDEAIAQADAKREEAERELLLARQTYETELATGREAVFASERELETERVLRKTAESRLSAAEMRFEQRLSDLRARQAKAAEDAHRASAGRAESDRLAAEREARVTELERLLAEARGAATTHGAATRALGEARARSADLERGPTGLEEQRAVEHAAQQRAHESAIAALRARIVSAELAKEALRDHLDAVRARELAELEASLMERLADAVERARSEAIAVSAAEVDRLRDQLAHAEHERASMQQSFDFLLDDLARSMEQTRAELESERARSRPDRAVDARRIEAFEALVASKVDAIEALEREADEARSEIPELEAEIVVLRSELLAVRRQLDAQLLGARIAGAELDDEHRLLERAERLLAGVRGDETD